MKKIAFIGAGSFDFTRELVRDILTYDSFKDTTICLMDIDSRKLSYIERACPDAYVLNYTNLMAFEYFRR